MSCAELVHVPTCTFARAFQFPSLTALFGSYPPHYHCNLTVPVVQSGILETSTPHSACFPQTTYKCSKTDTLPFPLRLSRPVGRRTYCGHAVRSRGYHRVRGGRCIHTVQVLDSAYKYAYVFCRHVKTISMYIPCLDMFGSCPVLVLCRCRLGNLILFYKTPMSIRRHEILLCRSSQLRWCGCSEGG
jgi:hypothetical protein